MTKYIIVAGGVISGIGKGVIASSSALLMKMFGLRVTSIKIDPYLNVDAGTLSPLDHGEVFVLDDGGEVDLDLGNYERFLDITLTREHNITTGKIYRSVIERERRGDFAGKTVQVVPHITDTIQDWIEKVALIPVDDSGFQPDVCIIELGGTVGDIESAPFIEAMRQFQFRVGPSNFALILVSLVPAVGSVGEQKSKPTQTSAANLRGAGLCPDIIACRSTRPLEEGVKTKISMFCHVTPEQVLGIHDCSSVYHVPLLIESQQMITILNKKLNLNEVLEQRYLRETQKKVDHDAKALRNKWTQLTTRQSRLHEEVKIAVVGKYTNLHDAYFSVIKALEHAALYINRKLVVCWIESTDLENGDAVKYHEAWGKLVQVDGVLVPGGFGDRGIEGKIAAVNWARLKKVPFLGLCLGMQVAVIEFARNVCQITDANSEEFSNNTEKQVIINMPEVPLDNLGATMRLGSRVTKFNQSSIMQSLHNTSEVSERHRHRFEVNPKFISVLESKGLKFVGVDETGQRMEIIELNDHPFFVGTQYHPEYKTRPLRPSPPFVGFLLASTKQNTKIVQYESEMDLS